MSVIKNKEIIDKIRKIKLSYQKEGFIILGVFGSYARGDETEESDIDILYETTKEFQNQYCGLNYFGKIYDIQQDLKKKFNKEVDIADIHSLNNIGKKYILRNVSYV